MTVFFVRIYSYDYHMKRLVDSQAFDNRPQAEAYKLQRELEVPESYSLAIEVEKI